MRAFVAVLGLCASAVAFAQVADGFDPGAYVQVELILFTRQAPQGATNRTGVREEVLDRDGPRAFPAGLLSIADARLTKGVDAIWFDREWSLIAPGLKDEIPAPELPAEVESLPETGVADVAADVNEAQVDQAEVEEVPETAEPPEEPSLWQRYRDWYSDLLANCYSQLDSDDWRLSRALSSLERSGTHRVLMHGAWIQPVSARPRPVLLTGGETGEVGVLSLTRAGFIEADVRFWRPHGTGYAELHDTRPMRSRRAYYFDHPMMGVIVRVDPIRVPSEYQ